MGGVKLLQFILILVIIGVIIYLLRLYRALRLEKRISRFAISSAFDEEDSLFDTLYNYFWDITVKFANLLSKSEVLSKYGEKYNKFINFSLKDKRRGIDYVSLKFVLAFGVVILSLITSIIHSFHIDMMVILLLFIGCFFVPDIFLNYEFNKKRKRIEEDLLKAIIIMNNAFQSGRNIMQATQIVKTELDGPIQDEFEKIYLDITYGLELDVVFNRFYERVKLEDAKYITTTLTLLNRTGGDIIKVFSRLEKSIFEKKNLENELHSLTASSQFLFKFLVFLPFVFVLIILVLNPGYFYPLISTSLGLIILTFIILLYILYILIIKRVLEVKI